MNRSQREAELRELSVRVKKFDKRRHRQSRRSRLKAKISATLLR